MTLGSQELYELFLALAPARLAAARNALEQRDASERTRELAEALLPLAVDAALLGAEGVAALAKALASAEVGADLSDALSELQRAVTQLSHGDASGARVDETALAERANQLLQPAEPSPLPAKTELSEVEHWRPELADDMLAAFLDECSERIEGLSTRLLELEQRGQDPELVAEIFRDLHTLKGSSGFAGLRKLNKIAHVAEDLMGELRSGARRVDRALIDVLLETLEVLRVILAQARAGDPIDVDVAELVMRLQHPEQPVNKLELPALQPAVARAAPQATLRIDFEKVDLLLNLVGEIVLSRGQLDAAQESLSQVLREVSLFRSRLAAALETGITQDGAFIDDLQRIERVLSEGYTDSETNVNRLGLAVGQLRDTVLKMRMVPIARLFTKYQRTVRDLAHELGKQARVALHGAETQLDKVLVEHLDDPLLHLVRNAVDHGIEPPEQRQAHGKPEQGLVELSAWQQGGQIVVVIRDDGGGLDPSALREKAVHKGLLSRAEAAELSDAAAFELIFHPGFSTKTEVSAISGRGVGMDVVRASIEKLKGVVLIRSVLNVGTEIELRLPLTLAITQVLAVRVSSELVALPLDVVVSAQTLQASELEAVASSTCVRIGEALIPIVDLGAALGLSALPNVGALSAAQGSVIIVQLGSERLGLVVQQVIGRHEVVIKSLGPLLEKTPCAAGAALIGERIALVVDLPGVAARLRQQTGIVAPVAAALASAEPRQQQHVLLAEDSDAVRETLERGLIRAGFQVTSASDGRQALELAQKTRFDAVCTDIMMPHLDGYQLIRALRELPDYRSIPIVVLSSKNARIDSLRGFDAGADAYLNKPADPGQLIQQLDALLSRR